LSQDYKIQIPEAGSGPIDESKVMQDVDTKFLTYKRILVQTEDPNAFDEIVENLKEMTAEVVQRISNSELLEKIHEFGASVDDLRVKKLNDWKTQTEKLLGEIQAEQQNPEVAESEDEPKLNIFNLANVSSDIAEINSRDAQEDPAESHIILDKTESYAKIPDHIELPLTDVFDLRCQRNSLKSQFLSMKATKEEWSIQGASEEARAQFEARKLSLEARLDDVQKRIAEIEAADPAAQQKHAALSAKNLHYHRLASRKINIQCRIKGLQMRISTMEKAGKTQCPCYPRMKLME
jgi:hypothetical protein